VAGRQDFVQRDLEGRNGQRRKGHFSEEKNKKEKGIADKKGSSHVSLIPVRRHLRRPDRRYIVKSTGKGLIAIPVAVRKKRPKRGETARRTLSRGVRKSKHHGENTR